MTTVPNHLFIICVHGSELRAKRHCHEAVEYWSFASAVDTPFVELNRVVALTVTYEMECGFSIFFRFEPQVDDVLEGNPMRAPMNGRVPGCAYSDRKNGSMSRF